VEASARTRTHAILVRQDELCRFLTVARTSSLDGRQSPRGAVRWRKKARQRLQHPSQQAIAAGEDKARRPNRRKPPSTPKECEQNDDGKWDSQNPKEQPATETHFILRDFLLM
jgi:hypothetical protein